MHNRSILKEETKVVFFDNSKYTYIHAHTHTRCYKLKYVQTHIYIDCGL